MLGKLLKYEILHTGRSFLWVLGIGLIVGGGATLLSFTRDAQMGQFLTTFLLNILLCLIAFVILILAMAFILLATSRSMFSEQGYLAFSLPVSSHQLLLAKFSASVLWLLLSAIEAAGLYIGAFFNIRRLILNAGDAVLSSLNAEGSMVEDFGSVLGLPSFGEILHLAIALFISVLVFLMLVMMVVIFVTTVSHVRPFQELSGLWTVVFLVASAIVFGGLTKVLSDQIHINYSVKFLQMAGEAAEMLQVNLFKPILYLIFTAGMFFLTDWLLQKKISLK
ncbi:MAG: hypothetical protein LBJ11_07365 [Oscillospiraceae bacterium]|jgi:hypothetical protein|nr:hypothetical protein [Oscillospiraceae bacterium]